jgi:UDP:flavonoid glycosyltransferase YjiC (YdhE family)
VRVLFASTRGAGHFNPLVPFIEACLRHRHEVLVVGPPALAQAVETAGAGLTVAPPNPAALRAAIERVLEDDAYARTARRIADEMRRLPPVDEAFST